MATGRTWAPRLKPYSSISVRTDTTRSHARLRKGANGDPPSRPGSQSRGESAVPPMDPASARSALPGAAAEASVRGGRPAPSPPANQGTARMRAHTPRQAVAPAPRTPRAPSPDCWCPRPGKLQLPSCNARSLRAHALGAPATRPTQRRALHAGLRCSAGGFPSQRGRGVAPGLGKRPIPASLCARTPC